MFHPLTETELSSVSQYQDTHHHDNVASESSQGLTQRLAKITFLFNAPCINMPMLAYPAYDSQDLLLSRLSEMSDRVSLTVERMTYQTECCLSMLQEYADRVTPSPNAGSSYTL